MSLHKFCFFVSVTLISFILKCYPLFCINFFYLKVVFHQIHVNLSRVNLQYTLFFLQEYYIGWTLQNFKNILRINPKLRYWKGYIFVSSKAVNTIQLYVFNLFHSLKGNWLGNKTKKRAPVNIIVYNGHVISHNLRIIQEYFLPKIGRKMRMFSLGRKNNILIEKKRVFLNFVQHW